MPNDVTGNTPFAALVTEDNEPIVTESSDYIVTET
jgi:hypothetical protein